MVEVRVMHASAGIDSLDIVDQVRYTEQQQQQQQQECSPVGMTDRQADS